MSDKEKMAALGAAIVAILLLLFLRARSGDTTIYQAGDVDLSVSPVTNTYTLPPLVSRGGAYDWMQTTDLACGCDIGLWKEPIYIGPSVAPVVSYPVYRYIVNTVTRESPAQLPASFPIYTPPRQKTWSYSITLGVNKDHGNTKYPLQTITTEDGKVFATWTRDRFGPSVIGTDQFTLSGDDLYYNGVRYVHDATGDKRAPYKPWASQGYGSLTAG